MDKVNKNKNTRQLGWDSELRADSEPAGNPLVCTGSSLRGVYWWGCCVVWGVTAEDLQGLFGD